MMCTNEVAGGIVVVGRAEIDTRPPFKSVREAVLLFGEKVLAGEVIPNKLKEIRAANETTGQAVQSRIEGLKAELKEEKQSLKRMRSENKALARHILSLQLELDEARRELNRLKHSRAFNNNPKRALVDPEKEDVKFVENLIKVEAVKKQTKEDQDDDNVDDKDEAEGFRLHQEEKKRLVKFASPPSLTRVIGNKDDQEGGDNNDVFEKASSAKKKVGMKKPLIELITGLFYSKKKGNSEARQG